MKGIYPKVFSKIFGISSLLSRTRRLTQHPVLRLIISSYWALPPFLPAAPSCVSTARKASLARRPKGSTPAGKRTGESPRRRGRQAMLLSCRWWSQSRLHSGRGERVLEWNVHSLCMLIIIYVAFNIQLVHMYLFSIVCLRWPTEKKDTNLVLKIETQL